MPTERVTERTDGTTERVVERDAGTPHPDHGGSGLGTTYADGGVGGVIIGIAVLALVAIVAFFLMTQSRNDSLRTSAVTGAASSVGRGAGLSHVVMRRLRRCARRRAARCRTCRA
jgi:hypothetical protein